MKKRKDFILDPQNTLAYNFKFDNKEHLNKMMLYASQKFGEYHKPDITLFEHGNQGVYAGIITITFVTDIDTTIKECIDFFYTQSIKLVLF